MRNGDRDRPERKSGLGGPGRLYGHGPERNGWIRVRPADGTAQYCYTGTAGGTDTEEAAVGSVTSNSASIGWALASTTTTTSLSGGGQSEHPISRSGEVRR